MEVKRHKLNDYTSVILDTELMNLNDHCILEIFQRLPLINLCKMSETCVRLRILAGKCFISKYPQLVFEEMKIGRKFGKINFEPKLIHVEFFSKMMPNLKVKFPSERDVAILQYIRAKCKNLRQIIFDGGCLLRSYGNDLEDVLEKVETVAFLQSVSQTSYFVEILIHCPRIKQLILHENHGGNKLNEVLLNKYPTLQHLKHIHEGTIDLDNLNTFFKQNPNVTKFTLYFCDLLEGNNNDNVLELIRCIAKNGIHLAQLNLSFYGYYDWTTISNEIEILCKRTCFKQLELKFHGIEAERMLTDHGSHIASHSCVQTLHFEEFSNLLETFVKIGSFPYLKNLHLTDVRFGEVNPFLVAIFPNLRQIQIVGQVDCENSLDNDNDYGYGDVITMFVCHLAKLTKILITGYIENLELDIDLMNRKRENLQYAEMVTIFNSEDLGDRKRNLIKIKDVEFRHDVYNFDHPLTSYFVINK